MGGGQGGGLVVFRVLQLRQATGMGRRFQRMDCVQKSQGISRFLRRIQGCERMVCVGGDQRFLGLLSAS